MRNWCIEIFNYIQRYINNSPILIFYIASLLFLCFRGRKNRGMLVYPSIVLLLVILNPWLYGHIWIKLIDYAFWRMLWMIPVLPVIAVAVIELAGLLKKEWLSYIAVVACIAVILLSGNIIYRQDKVFVKAQNAYKLPQECIDVADRILEYNSNPTVIAPSSLYCYLRQYNGNINLLYGRDVDGYILPSNDSVIGEINGMMRVGGDTERFAQLAREKNVDFIILPWDSALGMSDGYGYRNVCAVDGYNIYQRQE